VEESAPAARLLAHANAANLPAQGLMTFAPDRFAAQWEAAWNRQDLDAVLAHFAPDVVFTSPTASATVGHPTVTGRASLQAYWQAALARISSLHFTVVRTLWDGTRHELAIVYDRRVNGREDRAIECLRFGEHDLVVSGEVFYGVSRA
jgi:limonene-1,2-epoxide hydrolase